MEAGSKKVVELKALIGGDMTSHVMHHCRGNTRYTNLRLFTINAAKLKSVASDVVDCVTTKCR